MNYELRILGLMPKFKDGVILNAWGSAPIQTNAGLGWKLLPELNTLTSQIRLIKTEVSL
jgi:hypothetical protein